MLLHLVVVDGITKLNVLAQHFQRQFTSDLSKPDDGIQCRVDSTVEGVDRASINRCRCGCLFNQHVDAERVHREVDFTSPIDEQDSCASVASDGPGEFPQHSFDFDRLIQCINDLGHEFIGLF